MGTLAVDEASSRRGCRKAMVLAVGAVISAASMANNRFRCSRQCVILIRKLCICASCFFFSVLSKSISNPFV